MISVYKGVWQDKLYLVASETKCRTLHKKLGIPYYNKTIDGKVVKIGLRSVVSEKEAKLAASNLNKVFTKPISGTSVWTYERQIN